MRELFKPDLKMPKDNFEELFLRAEVFRSCGYLVGVLLKGTAKDYDKGKKRTDIITELKSLRAKTLLKEQETLPAVVYEAVQKVLWDR